MSDLPTCPNQAMRRNDSPFRSLAYDSYETIPNQSSQLNLPVPPGANWCSISTWRNNNLRKRFRSEPVQPQRKRVDSIRVVHRWRGGAGGGVTLPLDCVRGRDAAIYLNPISNPLLGQTFFVLLDYQMQSPKQWAGHSPWIHDWLHRHF